MSDFEEQLDQIRAHWDEKAECDPSDAAKVDATPRAQAMRFELFLSGHDVSNASILDVGCGVGDFWDHLRRRGIIADYLGVDLSPGMIRRAQDKYPEALFACQDIVASDPGRFDYTVSFGIHNVRIEKAREILETVTRRQFELCRRAAHISLLTDRFSGFGPVAMPWRAEEILGLCLEITPYVTLRHDYLPNDFSVTLYREPLIDTDPKLMLPPR